MVTKFQLVVDCADPERLVRFWGEALGYSIEGPPPGFNSWMSYWRSKGVRDDDNYPGNDSIVDPGGSGPRIWFQQVSEGKVVKNRLHIDIREGGGDEVPLATRKERVDAAAERLVKLGATRLAPLEFPGVDHYAVAMQDPEGNEFDIN